MHHIDSPSDDSADNALPLCFDCHADIHSQKEGSFGRAYTASELRRLRDETYRRHSVLSISPPEGVTDYGRGFHDGATWASRQSALEDIWCVLSVHGDFALEILIHFVDGDTHTMMDETLVSDRVDTGSIRTQPEGHIAAWSSGEAASL